MKLLQNILLISTIFLITQSYATIYEDGEDGNSDRWSVYDATPTGAYIENVYVEDRQTNVIQLIGAGTSNGYILGNWENKTGAWDNREQHILKWNMKFKEDFIIYVRVMTKDGARFIYYTALNSSQGKNHPQYIHIGLGEEANNGTWKNFTRDIAADLKKYEPNNELLAVNAFLVRGNGLLDDIRLVEESTTPPKEADILDKGILDITREDLIEQAKTHCLNSHNSTKSILCANDGNTVYILNSEKHNTILYHNHFKILLNTESVRTLSSEGLAEFQQVQGKYKEEFYGEIKNSSIYITKTFDRGADRNGKYIIHANDKRVFTLIWYEAEGLIGKIEISEDGKKLSMIRTFRTMEKKYIEVYDISDLSNIKLFSRKIVDYPYK